MKVKEWIEILKKFDPEKEVIYDGDGSCVKIEHIEYDGQDDKICIW